MALTTRQFDGGPTQPGDDYLVEAEQVETRTPIFVRALHGVQIILFAIVAILSLAVFWMIGLLIGLF